MKMSLKKTYCLCFSVLLFGSLSLPPRQASGVYPADIPRPVFLVGHKGRLGAGRHRKFRGPLCRSAAAQTPHRQRSPAGGPHRLSQSGPTCPLPGSLFVKGVSARRTPGERSGTCGHCLHLLLSEALYLCHQMVDNLRETSLHQH